MQTVYIYEGDFLSLLQLIFYLVKNNRKPENIKTEKYSPSLFENTIHLQLPAGESILEQMRNVFGSFALRSMYYVFLSEQENKELILYYFFRNALKYRQKILSYRNLKCVHEVLRLSQLVMHEVHKMKGFLRFKEWENNILYAEMAPGNDILFLVSLHFEKRLKEEFWVIKDVNRKILSIYDKKKFIIVREEEIRFSMQKESKVEKEMEDLWKTFYKAIAITERKNDRCRMNFMPKKYWKYITEVKDLL